MARFYDDLYTLCGYESDEIEEQRPRIEETLKRLEIGPDDMNNAENFVKSNFDLDLTGLRKILAIWLRELSDVVLARDEGKKIFYFGFPSIGGLGAAIAAASEDIVCAAPDVILCHTMGQIFNKLDAILKAGEETGLPAGHSLCTLQTVRVGALAKGIIPVPDLASLSSYYCDMGSKADDLLSERYGFPSVIVDGSMDSKWGEFPEFDPMRVKYLGAQLNKLFDEVDKHLGVRVTESEFRKAADLSLAFKESMFQLGDVMNADPVPISMADVSLALMLGWASTRTGEEMLTAINLLSKEAKKRVDEGFGVVPKGSPRVLIFFPSFSDPAFIHMMEDAGLAIPNQILLAGLNAPILESHQPTFGEQRAEIEMGLGFYHSIYGLIKRCSEVTEALKVDGFISNYLFNCRPVASASHLLKKYIEEETGIPVLSLEMDIYDSRYYSPSSLKTRVETFADILRAKKAAKS